MNLCRLLASVGWLRFAPINALSVHNYVSVLVIMCVHSCVDSCVHVCMSICMNIRACLFVSVSVYLCVCVHIMCVKYLLNEY